jgi:hypothetical protein
MTLKDLYTRVASLQGNQVIADCLCSATFLEIDNSRLEFKTFVETEHQATQAELATEYTLPNFILLWKMKDSMWFIEGADTQIEFDTILKAKTSCNQVVKIIRVDSRSELIQIVRDENIIGIDKILGRKAMRGKSSTRAFLLQH